MKVYQGRSSKIGKDAVEEVVQSWGNDAKALNLLLVFTSSAQQPDEIAAALQERFPNVPTFGGTTAGEWLGSVHSNGTLVVMGISTPEIKWSIGVLNDLTKATSAQVHDFASKLMSSFGVSSSEGLDAKKHFCLSIYDGLKGQEERISAMMAEELLGIQVLGGSAGDDLKFKATYVFANGKAINDAAVFALAESSVPFSPIKHQHFTRSTVDMVVTKATPATRTIHRLDGYPAIERFAELIGVPKDKIDFGVLANSPVLFSANNEVYLRSPGQLSPDGSITFFSAIEEGMVLHLGNRAEMVSEYNQYIENIKKQLGGGIELLIGFNCAYRALEMAAKKLYEPMAIAYGKSATNFVGFDTYGEQINGLHMNQTLTALAIGKK